MPVDTERRGNKMKTKQELDCRIAVRLLTPGSLSSRLFETRTATGREHFASQDGGVPKSFVVIISNGEKILGDVNVVV